MENFKLSVGAIAGIVALFISIMYFGVFGCNRITPTEVGFKISNSGDYRGIDSIPTEVGWVFTRPGFNWIVTLPTTQQHVVWSQDATEGEEANQQIVISCMGGAGFNMDIGLNYRVNPYKASKIYLKYRTSDLKMITSTYLRNVVRGTMQDLSGTMTVDSILNSLPFFEHTVADNLTKRLAPEGFIVDNFNITKKPTPTDSTLAAAINAKITAKQNVETSKMQVQQSMAEADKKIATARGDSTAKIINAMADAQVIKVKTAQLTANPQYLELIKIEKWNGSVPTYLGGNGTPLFNMITK